MAHEIRNGYVGNGALFKSTTKVLASHCDYNGDCEIEGRQYRVRGWVRADKKGDKFLSLGFALLEPGDIEPKDLL